jgi:diguanylate cyclase (GGDEF)-like protein
VIDLAAWDRAQEEQLVALRDFTAEGPALQQLLETSCLLELSKIAAAQPELVLFVQSTIEVIAQFFPIDWCCLDVHPRDLPAVSASFGEPAELSDLGARFPIVEQGEVVGALVASDAPDVLGGSQFFDRIAEQVGLGLAAVAETERLRRRAASATASRLAAGLEDWRDEPWIEELVAAIALLPNALGAELTIEGPAEGGPIAARAGLVDVEPYDDRREIVGAVGIRLGVSWDRQPDAGNRAMVDDVWSDLLTAVARAEEHRRLQELVETDELTGVGNRRRAVRSLATALRRAGRRGESVTVLMFDLDRFKAINDELGHAVGDAVLQSFASMLVRETVGGAVARMGGEEFLLVLPGVDFLAARAEADRLRSLVPQACGMVLPEGWVQTVSVGAAVFPTTAGFPDALVREADRALYEAKRCGRDQVAVAAATSDHPVRL